MAMLRRFAAVTQWPEYLVRHQSYLKEKDGVKMPKQLGSVYYDVQDHCIYNACCDSVQFKYLCISCGKNAGCYFCHFDPEVKHECHE